MVTAAENWKALRQDTPHCSQREILAFRRNYSFIYTTVLWPFTVWRWCR